MPVDNQHVMSVCEQTQDTGHRTSLLGSSRHSLSHPVDFHTDAFGCSHRSKKFNDKWYMVTMLAEKR